MLFIILYSAYMALYCVLLILQCTEQLEEYVLGHEKVSLEPEYIIFKSEFKSQEPFPKMEQS